LPIVHWKDYEQASIRWYQFWSGKDRPCDYHEFLGIEFSPVFSHRLKISVVPEDALHRIAALNGPHYQTAIIAWCVKTNIPWK